MLSITVLALSLARSSLATAMGNPASEFCDSLNGQHAALSENLEYANAHIPQESICRFGEAGVEEWTLTRYLSLGEPQQAIRIFLKSSAPKKGMTESKYCSAVGGKTTYRFSTENGAKIALCIFSDGSLIDQTTLFNGPKSPKNKILLDALTKKTDSKPTPSVQDIKIDDAATVGSESYK